MKSALQPESYPGLCREPLVERSLSDPESTRRFGARLGAFLGKGSFLGLIGDLGAGKTTLMQGLVEALSGSQFEASSPTYALVQEYETVPKVFHMDLYRLENLEDLESIGYWDYLDEREGLCCVEWLDRIPEAWPEKGWILELRSEGDGRRIRLYGDQEGTSEDRKRLVEALEEL